MQLPWGASMQVRIVGFILGGILLTGLAAGQPLPPQAASPLAPGTFRLRVTGHEVSIEAQEASVAAIFADIGQRTGIPVVIHPGVDERITIHFTRVALAEALKQLTPNVALVTAQGPDAPPHRIAKVYVFAQGQARPSQLEGAPASQAETANDAAARPAPFQFTFDPSQHMKSFQ
jgi:type II secretory pathway component GspD/PulD (secretin)